MGATWRITIAEFEMAEAVSCAGPITRFADLAIAAGRHCRRQARRTGGRAQSTLAPWRRECLISAGIKQMGGGFNALMADTFA
jgi:hypothetical protein